MKNKELAIKIIKRELGSCEDNFNRAKMQFGSASSNMMKSQYGQSGRTCQEIFDGYRNGYNEVKNCLTWIESI